MIERVLGSVRRVLARGLAGWVVAVAMVQMAAAQGIAMVTDVSGKVGGPAPVTIMSELAADARLDLAAGAALTVIYLKSGDEYAFSGPGQVQFRADAPQVISGAQPRKRASPLAKAGAVSIKPVPVKQAAFVMRSSKPTTRISLLTLSGTKTLDATPEFRWQELESGLTYRFELVDDTGRSLQEAQVQGPAFKLPDSVQLREGITYTWEVSTRTPDGRRYVSAGDFSLAAADLRSQAGALRPGAGASVSDRVAYAAWLEQENLKDEARKYWRALSAERPQDAKLKELAGE
jgi:hypothetical protein